MARKKTQHEVRVARTERVPALFDLVTLFVAVATVIALYMSDHTLKETLRSQNVHTEQQLRAYVVVDKVTVLPEAAGMTATVGFKNAGQTPAYSVTTWAEIGIKAAAGPVPKMGTSGDAGSSSPLGPGVGAQASIPKAFQPGDFDAVRADEREIYIQGWIKYVDAFKQPHYVDFKYIAHRSGKEWSAQPTPDGNDSN